MAKLALFGVPQAWLLFLVGWGEASLFFYSIIFRTQLMHSEGREIEDPASPQGRSRVLGVIVLTDNRQHPPADKPSPLPHSLRSSAFRQPDTDPLDYFYDRMDCPEGELERLAQRVSALEQRLLELSQLEASTSTVPRSSDGSGHKKKQRRKFKDLVRNQQCGICQKIYGSETSLKYHLKLKHAKHDENHSQSN